MRKFLGRSSSKTALPSNIAPANHATPDDALAYAIGDVHGCLGALDQLLEKIKQDRVLTAPEKRGTLVFLGDYIDRGPDSSGVLERLKDFELEDFDSHFLMGNHEEIFLSVLDGNLDRMSSWLRYGGRDCAYSYGVDNLGDIAFAPERVLHQLQSRVPESHIDFLRKCIPHFVFGDYVFVHAGLRPELSWEEQSRSDMMWIRDDFLDYQGAFPFKVVHGHSVVDVPENRSNRIAVDTGAYKPEGQLTAVRLEGKQVDFLTTDL